jgi:ATP-dependent helicase YprA (DUF1998 family)
MPAIMNPKSSKYLDPIKAVTQPREDLIRYLLTAYPLRDRHLRYGLKKLLEQQGNIWQEPYLEGSQPYRSTTNVAKLVTDGVLHPEMENIFTPSDRALYEHQEKAVKAVIQDRSNIVVATGTGSGKTECFLLPMFDTLLREEENLVIPGVRVVILYPMNALVNDQVKRLRKLLCKQKNSKIRFGFYTSRTETDEKKAREMLAEELSAYEDKELDELFSKGDRIPANRDEKVAAAIDNVLRIQAISREEIQAEPPHILVTNYSMLEHMLIRPTERKKVFEASKNVFKMLVVDEAHSYNGSTGSEVAMLLERLKVAVGIEEKGKVRCIATSASLGDESVDDEVKKFAKDFFGEQFDRVIRGDREPALERMGEPYLLPSEYTAQKILTALSNLDLPSLDDELNVWVERLRGFIPAEPLEKAKIQANGDIHKLLWLALKQHPLVHRLIYILSRKPEPWSVITKSAELWGLSLPTESNVKEAETALARLLQLGTMARQRDDDLPLLPVKIHLLFRSLEGLYACVNPQCCRAETDPEYADKPRRYGRLYLNERKTCEDCSSPVLEVGSCSQCGQAYSFTQINSGKLESLPRSYQGLKDNKNIYTLTSGNLDSITEDDEIGESEEEKYSLPQTMIFRDGWIGIPEKKDFRSKEQVEGEFHLAWHRHKNDKDSNGCYLPKCAACGVRPTRSQTINRFVTYTDEPLQIAIDSLFELLPEAERHDGEASERKLLTFSDGRQDAAFFASDYQRNSTEKVYRQMLWQSFQVAKGDDGVATVKKLTERLKLKFVEISIPHPDRTSADNYKSYRQEDEQSFDNRRDCEDKAEKRAKEILIREFALPFNRRSTFEAYTLIACHLDLSDDRLFESISNKFGISTAEARIFVTVLTDIIRRTGIVNIEGSSNYFPETGGVDGTRPEMIDTQGKSKNYLFLEKGEAERKKYEDSPSFLPKWKKDGEVSKAQNRLGWYYHQFFGDRFPTREDFIWLFDKLKEYRILTPAKSGYHLKWDNLNIIETKHDWQQCDSCQQVFHIPNLSDIKNSTLNITGCPAFRCEGTLQPYTLEQIERTREEHYQQHLILNRSPLPLRSQEHTAQLGTGELEKRENRFRRGQINMLSCSTTLEMGVDIGDLQAVVLRNFPPHVSNYQQRAGRAGRRTDGVAITLMYGQRRPHDRYYFEKPERLIAGTNQIPKLDVNNRQIQERHVRAELLAAFLYGYSGVGAEKITMADFLALPFSNPAAHPDFTPPQTATIVQLQEWLNKDEARSTAQSWIDRLGSSDNKIELLDFPQERLCQRFIEALAVFQKEQLADWNNLASPLREISYNFEDIEKSLNQVKNIKAELKKIAKRRLHDELVQASILPIYGFPIDVVRLLTGESNEFKSSQGKHRLERDRRLALGEYAPGQEIVVDDRVYKSVGITRPKELENKYYWVCKENCNHFHSSPNPDPIEECPVCQCEPKLASNKDMKQYKIPKSFMTDWSKPAKVTPYIKPQPQPTSQVFLAQDGQDPKNIPYIFCDLTVSRSGTFFLANQGGLLGRGKGFAICQNCGIDLSDLVLKQREASSKKGRSKKSDNSHGEYLPHQHPLTGKSCTTFRKDIHLGHEFCSDLLKIQFNPTANPPYLFGGEVRNMVDGTTISSVENDENKSNGGLNFWRSLTYALLAAAALVIDVPRNELDGLFRPLNNRSTEIIIYDNVPGGAGYSKRIAERFSEVLERAYKLTNECECGTSCYDCLRTYSNQPFHNDLDRCSVVNFLQPLVTEENNKTISSIHLN